MIRNAHGQLQEVAVFLTNSAKRVHILQQEVSSILPESKVTNLKKLCATRWVKSHTAVITFLSLLDPAIGALEIIGASSDRCI